MVSEHAKNPSKQVTEARAAAQRTELNAQAAERRRTAEQTSKTKRANGKQGQRDLLAKQCLSQSGLLPSIPMFIGLPTYPSQRSIELQTVSPVSFHAHVVRHGTCTRRLEKGSGGSSLAPDVPAMNCSPEQTHGQVAPRLRVQEVPPMECSHEHTHEGAATALSVLGEKWTIQLLHQIVQGNNRFGQLQRAMKGISPKTLTVRLRELEEAGILTRKVFPGFPLHVEYAATERGEALGKVIRAMDEWGEKA